MNRLFLVAALSACAPPAHTALSTYVAEPGKPPWPRLISGRQAIAPDQLTIELASVEYARLMSTWRLCIDASGAVTAVNLLSSSGFPNYDAAIHNEMINWKHASRDGGGEICKAVTFVYALPR